MGRKREKKGRKACCSGDTVKRGAWSGEEDKLLLDFISKNAHATWRNLPHLAGLQRCGKSCRLRWKNYLQPNIRRGPFSHEEETKIIHLHGMFGNKWAAIASHLPGRTDNDIKNFWNSHLRKRFTSFKSLDSEPLSVNAVSSDRGDYFLRLWNSQVGDSFRGIIETGQSHVNSPNSQISSSLTEAEPETEDYKVEALKEPDSPKSTSYEYDDSSEAMLDLLLDIPLGEDDMGFLQP